MNNETSVRFRMVRCPKCSKLLVELPEFTLYKCGGCGTSLQAKNWKPESASERPEISGIEAPSSTDNSMNKENERFEDEGENCRVDELCLDTSAPSSHSGSPEVKPSSNTDSIEALGEECKNSPVGRSENSDIKLDDEEHHSSLTGVDLGINGGVGIVNRDLGFVSSPGTFSNEGDNASQSSATQDSEVDDGNNGDGDNVGHLKIGSSSPQRTTTNEIGGGDSSRSSPILESHVSLYITSPDDADHLDHSPARRFSSSDGYDINDRDFTNHKSGSYHAYYGSESSYDGNEDLSFQHTSRGNRKNNKRPEEYISGSMMRLKNAEIISKFPLTSSDPELLHKSRDHSSFIRSSLPPRPSSRPLHDPLLSSDPAKMDLLRTVKELKDQLKKMQIPNRMFPPSGVQEKYDAPFNHKEFSREADLVRSRGEPCRDHMRCSCLQCCPHSAQIPSHFVHHCNNGHCTMQTGHSCCDMSSSGSSPHHYCMGSSHSSACNGMKYQDEKLKRLFSKDKDKPPKKRLLPLAGGAPIVTCYYCLELLQLPADFVVFNTRRCHRLMCSSCNKVLRFSILEGTKIVRYLPNASATPAPSEAGESSNARTVSCSDDQSFERRDCSERGEKNSNSRKISLDRKMKSALRDSRNENEGLGETDEAVGSSSKVVKWKKTTSDVEERSKLSNSPLHRLMGYSSPRRVLNN